MHSQGISQYYMHIPRSSANGMNHTCLFIPGWSWSSFTNPEGMEGWVGLGGWLHTEINVRHWEFNSSMGITVSYYTVHFIRQQTKTKKQKTTYIHTEP